MKTPKQTILESGLSRIRNHMLKGPIGIISASTDKPYDAARHTAMAKRFRELGYGPIQATGRSVKWGPERSFIVPNVTAEHLKKVGDEFGQQAVIHVKAGGKKATTHFLKASDKPGTSEEIGAAHFNRSPEDAPKDKRENFGMTILKGIGFKPSDTRKPTRSFALYESENDFELERLIILPMGILHPQEVDYGK